MRSTLRTSCVKARSRVPSSSCAISCSRPRRTPDIPPKTSAVLSASMRKMLARLASALALSVRPLVASSCTMRHAWNTPASAITRASRIGIEPTSERRVAALDDAAAEADVAVIEDDRLTRRDRALRLVERHLAAAAGNPHRAGLIGLAVTRLCRAAELADIRRRAGDPGQFI